MDNCSANDHVPADSLKYHTPYGIYAGQVEQHRCSTATTKLLYTTGGMVQMRHGEEDWQYTLGAGAFGTRQPRR